MAEPWARVLLHEYFYKRFSELDQEQRDIIYAMRTKMGLIIQIEKLWLLEIEKHVLQRVYHDLKTIL